MRLEVTRKTDLAARALIALDLAGERLKASDLAQRIGTTPGYVTQVVAPLVSNGWVTSEPGPTGGYSLATALPDLSVLAVVEAVEGRTDDGRCVLQGDTCGGHAPCALHDAWAAARRELVERLTHISIRTVADGPVPPLAVTGLSVRTERRGHD